MVGFMNARNAVTWLALLASSTTAFAPSSAFLGTRRQSLSSTGVPAPSTTSSTSLQMNLFDRFSRVAKATANDILKNLEDPEKIMNQALEDMQVRTIDQKRSYELVLVGMDPVAS
jgi:phage shock protein A